MKDLLVVCTLIAAATARAQDETPPSPREVAQALQEHREAVGALKTVERALEASQKKLGKLLRLVGERPSATAVPVVPTVPSGYIAPVAVPPAPVTANKVAGPDPIAERTAELLSRVADQLTRLDGRLGALEARLAELERERAVKK